MLPPPRRWSRRCGWPRWIPLCILRSELPLVVGFWAPWCAPCLSMAPQFAAAAATLEPQVRLAKVDTDLHPALGTRFGIRSIPTLLVIRGGHEIGRHSGAVSSAQIVSWVRSVLDGR
nr:thioredoxin domain-containing protein [Xanthomonas arboricola]